MRQFQNEPHNASRIDFSFKGNWLVNYDAKEFNSSDILIKLAQIQDYFDQNSINFNSINIIFNKNSKINYFYQEKGAILLSFCNINKEFEEIKLKPSKAAAWKPLEKPIKSIDLLFPRLDNDPRWKTMGLPAGQMFLASSLRAGGFEATPLPLVLPAQNWPPEALLADMAGITLFEDLLPILGPLLAVFRYSYKGIISAGGPFPTLAPLAAIYNLPQVNLFIRGEAELSLPKFLDALNNGDAGAFFALEGGFWQQPGLIAMTSFDKVNRPDNLSSFTIDFDFLEARHLEKGLEMNFSRGCCRGCMFCCRAQGTKFRKLPLKKVDELLKAYRKKVDDFLGSSRPHSGPPPLVKGVSNAKSATGFHSSCPPLSKGGNRGDQYGGDTASDPQIPSVSQSPREMARAVNINDDDILQDPAYADEIFSLIKKHGFRIFGIQTSTASLVKGIGSPNLEVLDLVSDPGIYIDDRPLLWLGTDTFLPARARRLGKKLPPAENFTGLLAEMEKRGLRHFHYWISSDGDSSWEEFVEELALIFGFFRNFPGFGLLAHAPFIVPYPSSRLFQRLPAGTPGLKVKLELPAPDPRFSYRVIDRLETKWPQLNCLLRNEKAGGEKDFFDFLKEKNLIAAAQLAYHFLKQEEFQNPVRGPKLFSARKKLENLIGELLDIHNS